MSKHARAGTAFLTSALAGPVVGFLAYLPFREPCPPVAGISLGDCVFGQTLGDFVQAAGVVGLLAGLAVGAYFEKS